MPVERGYEAQVAPREGAAMPLASAASMGAGVGAALAETGDALHTRKVQAYQAERRLTAEREAADFNHRFALHRQNMDDIVRQRRTNGAPGGAGHVEAVKAAEEAAQSALLDGISEDSVRRMAQGQLDEYRTRLTAGEADFAEGQRVTKLLADVKGLTGAGTNRVRRGSDPDVYAQELKFGYAAIDALQNVTPEQRAALKRELVDEPYAAAFIGSLQDSNPTVAKGLIDGGAFDHLRPEVLEQLRSGTDVEIRRAEAAAQHAASVAAGQYREQVATVRQLSEDGIDVSEQLPGLIAQAQAAGDTSVVADLQGLGRDAAFAKVWGGAPPLQRQARLQALQAIPDDKRSMTDQAELKWLQDKRSGLDGRFNSDPVGWAIESAPEGGKPPAVDFDDPATLAARAAWARTARGTYGSMGMFTAAERDALSRRMSAGHGGYVEVMNALATLPAVEARRAAKEAAPQDAQLQHLVTLPQAYRKRALDGRAALMANPSLLKPEDDGIRDVIDAETLGLNRALMVLPQVERNAIKQTAEHIAAGYLGSMGGKIDAELWGHALNMALGARGVGKDRQGGLGRWNGHYFLVPDGVTAQDFTNRVFGLVARNPKVGPVNPDGSPASLRHARPVAVRPGIYQFFVGDRAVLGKGADGKITSPWEFHIGGGR